MVCSAQIKSAATFQYFDSAGVRYTGAGDTNISAINIVSGVSVFGPTGTISVTSPDPWDIRFGTTVNGITGKLKTACRNAVNSTKYNFDGAVSGLGDTAMTSGSTADV